MMKTRWFIITWVVRGMLILTILGGCVPTATPPSATSPAVLVGSGYYGQGLTDQSWASITDIANLSPLAVGAADSAILANGWVKVNNAGKAKVYKPDVCEAVYVFYDSGIQIGTGCEQDGGGNWNCVVGAAISQNCSVGIQTPAVSITTTGTYYSVISLGDSSLVLITVLEGEVRVVPVTRLNYQLNFTDRGPDLQPITKADRVENNDLAVVLHQGQSYFTAPDDYLVDLRRNLAIRSFVDAPPIARRWTTSSCSCWSTN